MSATVTYKGATLTTAENQTRVLKTAGKYMEDDVTITDVTSGGGGDDFKEFVEGNTTVFSNSDITSVRSCACYSWASLSAVDLPEALHINGYAFYSCRYLSSVSLPKAMDVGVNAFTKCASLTAVVLPSASRVEGYCFESCSKILYADLPQVVTIGEHAFGSCSRMSQVSMPMATGLGNSAFYSCASLQCVSLEQSRASIATGAFRACVRLTSLYMLHTSSVASIGGSTAFYSTPMLDYSATAGEWGKIYVPASLYDSYLTHSIWSWMASRFVSV